MTTHHRWAGAVAVGVGLALASPARAGGIAPDLDKKIHANPTSNKSIRVIVQFTRPGVDSKSLAQAFGGYAIANHPNIKGAILSIPQSAVAGLSHNPNVAWISPDRPVSANWDYDAETVGADKVWATQSFRGTGVRVAVLDSGVYDEYDGAADWNRWGTNSSRIVAWVDLLNNWPYPYDDNGHGTHVAGIVLGSGNYSPVQSTRGLFTGTAPDADLVAVKVLDNHGAGTASNVIAGLNWVVSHKSQYNIRVVNMSLGHNPGESYTTDPLCAAVRNAVQAGIVVVCSAGNKGKDSYGQLAFGGIACPGNEPSAITIGAVNTHYTSDRTYNTICTYSSRGPTYIDNLAKPDLVAPGNQIASVRAPGSYLDTAYPGNRVDPSGYGGTGTPHYFYLSGTSMASPQVAGVVALMLQANPGLNPSTVKAILMYTAQYMPLADGLGMPLDKGLSHVTQGAGNLNAVGAVEVAGKLNTSAAVGSTWLTASLSNQSTIGNCTFPWYQQVLWGNQERSGSDLLGIRQQLWSGAVLWGDPVSWSNQCLWADNGVTADQCIWSDQCIWADQVLWSDSTLWSAAIEGIEIDGDPIDPPADPLPSDAGA